MTFALVLAVQAAAAAFLGARHRPFDFLAGLFLALSVLVAAVNEFAP